MTTTAAEVLAAFKKHKLEKIGTEVIKHSRPAVQIRKARANARSFSKFGGAPDLPPGTAWPTRTKAHGSAPLSFLAQIDFSVASKHDQSGLLPKEGRAWFFYDVIGGPWGFDPKHADGFCVIYHSSVSDLRSLPLPKALFDDSSGQCGAFEERHVSFGPIETFPTLESCAFADATDIRMIEVFAEVINGGQGENDNSAFHRLLGFPTVVQSPMELDCQLASNGIYLGDVEIKRADRKKAKALEAGASDWILLLQLDTDDSLWMWGDMGLLYFWIRKQDLAARDFSKVWVILQCG